MGSATSTNDLSHSNCVEPDTPATYRTACVPTNSRKFSSRRAHPVVEDALRRVAAAEVVKPEPIHAAKMLGVMCALKCVKLRHRNDTTDSSPSFANCYRMSGKCLALLSASCRAWRCRGGVPSSSSAEIKGFPEMMLCPFASPSRHALDALCHTPVPVRSGTESEPSALQHTKYGTTNRVL